MSAKVFSGNDDTENENSINSLSNEEEFKRYNKNEPSVSLKYSQSYMANNQQQAFNEPNRVNTVDSSSSWKYNAPTTNTNNSMSDPYKRADISKVREMQKQREQQENQI
jgi:hypothetical protein